MVLGGMFLADEVETPEPVVVADSEELVESGGVALLSLPTPFKFSLLLSKEEELMAGNAVKTGLSNSKRPIPALITSMSGSLYCHIPP
jgi:hypothetical protein